MHKNKQDYIQNEIEFREFMNYKKYEGECEKNIIDSCNGNKRIIYIYTLMVDVGND